MSGNYKYSGPASSAFPLKLMEILDTLEDKSHIFSWLPHGRGFTIKDKQKFASEILPQHFKVVQFTSFTRRMNRWRFTLQKAGNHKSNYFHPLFIRGEIDKCLQMCPKPQKQAIRTGSRKKNETNASRARTGSVATTTPELFLPNNMSPEERGTFQSMMPMLQHHRTSVSPMERPSSSTTRESMYTFSSSASTKASSKSSNRSRSSSNLLPMPLLAQQLQSRQEEEAKNSSTATRSDADAAYSPWHQFSTTPPPHHTVGQPSLLPYYDGPPPQQEYASISSSKNDLAGPGVNMNAGAEQQQVSSYYHDKATRFVQNYSQIYYNHDQIATRQQVMSHLSAISKGAERTHHPNTANNYHNGDHHPSSSWREPY